MVIDQAHANDQTKRMDKVLQMILQGVVYLLSFY